MANACVWWQPAGSVVADDGRDGAQQRTRLDISGACPPRTSHLAQIGTDTAQ